MEKVTYFVINRMKVLCKPNRAFWKDQGGMTMVEVLMGFAILSFMMGSLSGIMAFSSNMLAKSVDLRRAEEAVQVAIYKKEPSDKANKVATSFSLINPKDGKTVDITCDYFVLSSKDILTDEETKSLDVRISYFKAQ